MAWRSIVFMIPLVALAQGTTVQVQSAAGAIDREAAQAALAQMAEPLGECFEEPATALATLRVERSGSVASVRFMEPSGDERVDRCLSRVLRGTRFDQASGRSTVYVRVRRD